MATASAFGWFAEHQALLSGSFAQELEARSDLPASCCQGLVPDPAVVTDRLAAASVAESIAAFAPGPHRCPRTKRLREPKF
jgi:hypothetical protein